MAHRLLHGGSALGGRRREGATARLAECVREPRAGVRGGIDKLFSSLSLECAALGGDWLVVFSNEGSLVFFPYGRILARNLVTGQEVVVAQGEASPQDGVFGCPAVDGDTVAYTRALGSSLFPFVHDLGTGVATRLTYAFDTVAADMRVSGDRVVWRDSREGVPYQIWMHER